MQTNKFLALEIYSNFLLKVEQHTAGVIIFLYGCVYTFYNLISKSPFLLCLYLALSINN